MNKIVMFEIGTDDWDFNASVNVNYRKEYLS